MGTRTRLQSAAAVSSLLLVLGVAGLVALDGDSDPGAMSPAKEGSDPPRVAPDAPAAGSGEDGTTGTTPRGATAAPQSTMPTQGSAPRSTGPPRDGTYVYRTADGTTERLQIKTIEQGSGITRQVETTTTDEGRTSTRRKAWTSQGRMLDALFLPTQSQDGTRSERECDLKPDVLEIPSDLSAGQTWSSKGTCTLPSHESTSTVTVEISGRALRLGSDTVGSESVPVWEIELTQSMTNECLDCGSAAGAPSLVPMRSTSNHNFAPTHGLVTEKGSPQKRYRLTGLRPQ